MRRTRRPLTRAFRSSAPAPRPSGISKGEVGDLVQAIRLRFEDVERDQQTTLALMRGSFEGEIAKLHREIKSLRSELSTQRTLTDLATRLDRLEASPARGLRSVV